MKFISYLLWIGMASLPACQTGPGQPAAGASAADIDKVHLQDLQGRPISLKQFRGQTVFINYWATWCGPCLQEMPSIQRAKEQLEKRQVLFILASEENAESIAQFSTSSTYPFTFARVTNIEDLNVMALPTTQIFGPDGRLRYAGMGAKEWDAPENINIIINSGKQP